MAPPNDVFLRGLAISQPGSGPTRGLDLQSGVQCYALPYGALGCVSHALTYYTLTCLWFGRSPLWPFWKLSCRTYNIVITSGGLAISTIISIITIVNCQNIWQFSVIAAWKMSISLLSGITGIHVACATGKNGEASTKDTRKSMWWIVIYFLGMIAGMSGLMSLVAKFLPLGGRLAILTGCFFGIMFISMVIILLPCTRNWGNDNQVSYTSWLVDGSWKYSVLFTFLAAFYSDLALGMMTDNLIGLPSSKLNAAMFCLYFIAKRLMLLCV
ncbi:hypothetical protein P691DRAFT_724712 [Macrolepiota fuliginosa MF-IS2]|uniref:Uncharacterized protein n=1 Tax=Macrolepiota fuliginosa MF-IS2 TaxID=1400762 RepID=A0A9P6C6Q2_9AGAR|nr:hypothetical protein P691DRAFT_724712 [Macrolepiota fuliginosa MF-IS2]